MDITNLQFRTRRETLAHFRGRTFGRPTRCRIDPRVETTPSHRCLRVGGSCNAGSGGRTHRTNGAYVCHGTRRSSPKNTGHTQHKACTGKWDGSTTRCHAGDRCARLAPIKRKKSEAERNSCDWVGVSPGVGMAPQSRTNSLRGIRSLVVSLRLRATHVSRNGCALVWSP